MIDRLLWIGNLWLVERFILFLTTANSNGLPVASVSIMEPTKVFSVSFRLFVVPKDHFISNRNESPNMSKVSSF